VTDEKIKQQNKRKINSRFTMERCCIVYISDYGLCRIQYMALGDLWKSHNRPNPCVGIGFYVLDEEVKDEQTQ